MIIRHSLTTNKKKFTARLLVAPTGTRTKGVLCGRTVCIRGFGSRTTVGLLPDVHSQLREVVVGDDNKLAWLGREPGRPCDKLPLVTFSWHL